MLANYGFPINTKTRPQIINQLEQAIREKTLLPAMPAELIMECRTFVRQKTLPSPRAQDGNNDDRVMACALALEMYRQYGTHERRLDAGAAQVQDATATPGSEGESHEHDGATGRARWSARWRPARDRRRRRPRRTMGAAPGGGGSSIDFLDDAEEALNQFIQVDPDEVDRAKASKALQIVLDLKAANQTDTQAGGMKSLARALSSGGGAPAGGPPLG